MPALSGRSDIIEHSPNPADWTRWDVSGNDGLLRPPGALWLLEGPRADAPEFLPPFEEFSNLVGLRCQCGSHFATKAPLAIYSPPTRYLAWKLGRKNHLQWSYDRQLRASQDDDTATKLEYDWERIYILLYRWMDGCDLEQAHAAGFVSEAQMIEWTRESANRLMDLGWMVLDHKPRHLIVRAATDKHGILRRHGQPVLGLIDYELLVPAHPA